MEGIVCFLGYRALVWLGICFIDSVYVVVEVWPFVSEHGKESIYMMFIELNLITPVTVILKLSKVPNSTRCSCVQFNLREKQVKQHMQQQQISLFF